MDDLPEPKEVPVLLIAARLGGSPELKVVDGAPGFVVADAPGIRLSHR